MENNGLIQISISLVKRDEYLAKKILHARGWGEEKLNFIMGCLTYNVMTIEQFCVLTNNSRSTVQYWLTPTMRKSDESGQKEMDTLLDYCYPFKNIDGPGQKFIVRNKKCEKYLGK